MSRNADFDALVTAYADDLFRYAFWLCRDEQRAEDLVQETFLRAWRGYGRLREVASGKAWLITTLRREHYRRRPETNLVSLDNEGVESAVGAVDMLPISDALDIERRLDSLPAAYREVLVLQLLFGYTTVEIAGLLEVSEPAVANRLLRARRALSAVRSAPSPPLYGTCP
ncbi:MAG: sigma-70 family RNA polymerase sigma factor [Pseudomonadota bacterium]|nr:sigma-70 family RNA polymerase sigma factor [Pseudomonadota bacterium]